MPDYSSAVLVEAKREGWRLTRRYSQGTPDCPRCELQIAWEVYSHPAEELTRMFDVCDECGFSTEVLPYTSKVSNAEEGRVVMLAGLYARGGCVPCQMWHADFIANPSDLNLNRLMLHVAEHEDEEGGD